MGMVLIGMSLGSAFGFCFYIGLWFGELHSSLPFLLLGIGVDDMYVIVQGISNLSDSDKKLPIPDRIGIAMKHAGVSITVTSVTDMAAFLIGSSSVSLNYFHLMLK
jgi:Niemann-Pick C1 protein